MQILKVLASLPARIRSFLSAMFDRWRKPPCDDEAHIFHSRSYPGSRMRRYWVHLPHGKNRPKPRSLVLVLHGCRQNNFDIEQIAGFNKLADKYGFLVAYPFVTSYGGFRFQNCWGWWYDREIHAGTGEVEDLWQIVEEIKQHYAVDDQRIHVTGLSSGAGMAVALMVAHADKIASGAAVAGVPYSEKPDAVRHAFNRFPSNKPVDTIVSAMQKEMGTKIRGVPLQIIHSENDRTVDIQSAKNLRDSWGQCFGVDTRQAYKVSNGKTHSTGWQHKRYRNGRGKSFIETLFLSGPGHGWYGGNPGEFSYPDAPDISRLIHRFFILHKLTNK